MPLSRTLKRLPLISLAGMALVVLAMLAAAWLMISQGQANRLVVHTIRVETMITQLLERARAVESGHRGYLISGGGAFGTEVVKAERDLWATFEDLRIATADNTAQQANLDAIEPELRAKVAFAAEGLALVRAGSTERALDMVESGRGRILMDKIAARVAMMIAEEERLLASRREATRWLTTGIGFGLAFALLLMFIVAVVVVRDTMRRSAQMAEARALAEENARILQQQIDAREAAEGQLRQMHKMESIGQLTGGIAHDFNNMLAIVIGSLDLARRRADDKERVQKAISHALEGAERAAALTSRLLAFSRQQPLAPVSIDANKLVSGMSELLRRTLGEQISVETVLAGGLWRTYVDSGQLENAILNLAVNARDAMLACETGGRLTIETANAHLDDAYARERTEVTPGQYVLICISDTGTGMSPEVIERAFDPFFTTKEVGKGTGLGLSQVFGFTKQSGGHIAIYSEPGEGTTIKLYLPRYLGAETDAGPAVPDDGELPRGSIEEIILVVEDEQRVRHFSVDALRELGYTAISAANGAEALTILAEQPKVALLFTDVVMPEMNGRRLADEARAIRPNLRILYTTGYTRNAVVHNGMLDAGVAFLPKPFTVAQLARKVRDVIDGGGANRPA